MTRPRLLRRTRPRSRSRSFTRVLTAGVLTGLLCTACTSGLVYTHITVPLDLNAEGLPREMVTARNSVDELSLNVVRVAWGNAGLAATARAHGLESIAYADLEILSVLGVWRQEYAVLYGRRAPRR